MAVAGVIGTVSAAGDVGIFPANGIPIVGGVVPGIAGGIAIGIEIEIVIVIETEIGIETGIETVIESLTFEIAIGTAIESAIVIDFGTATGTGIGIGIVIERLATSEIVTGIAIENVIGIETDFEIATATETVIAISGIETGIGIEIEIGIGILIGEIETGAIDGMMIGHVSNVMTANGLLRIHGEKHRRRPAGWTAVHPAFRLLPLARNLPPVLERRLTVSRSTKGLASRLAGHRPSLLCLPESSDAIATGLKCTRLGWSYSKSQLPELPHLHRLRRYLHSDPLRCRQQLLQRPPNHHRCPSRYHSRRRKAKSLVQRNLRWPRSSNHQLDQRLTALLLSRHRNLALLERPLSNRVPNKKHRSALLPRHRLVLPQRPGQDPSNPPQPPQLHSDDVASLPSLSRMITVLAHPCRRARRRRLLLPCSLGPNFPVHGARLRRRRLACRSPMCPPDRVQACDRQVPEDLPKVANNGFDLGITTAVLLARLSPQAATSLKAKRKQSLQRLQGNSNQSKSRRNRLLPSQRNPRQINRRSPRSSRSLKSSPKLSRKLSPRPSLLPNPRKRLL